MVRLEAQFIKMPKFSWFFVAAFAISFKDDQH